MRILITILFGLFLYNFAIAQGWKNIWEVEGYGSARYMDFKEDFGVLVVDPNLIMTSEDRGKTWDTVKVSLSVGEISFTDVQILEDNSIIASGWRGYVIKSTDQGKSWKELKTNYNQYYASLSFPTSNIGYITSVSSDTLIKTTNGGNSWFLLDNPLEMANDVYFFDDNYGLICGKNAQNNGELFATSDGGNSWVSTYKYESHIFTKLSSIDGVIYIGTDKGKLLISNDNGANWLEKSISADNYVVNLFFLNKEIGWAAMWNSGTIYATTDGGDNWFMQFKSSNMNNKVFEIYFFDENHGFATGSNYVFLETFTGGRNTTIVEDGHIYKDRNNKNYLYPNPSKGNVHITNPFNNCKIEIIDAKGELVFQKQLNDGISTLNLQLPIGPYFIKYISDKYYKTEKIIIEN